MSESKLRNLAVEFSVKIIKLCENIKGHYSLTNQLERSGTSIGTNIREAFYGHGKNDFISKLQIALGIIQYIIFKTIYLHSLMLPI